VVLDIHGCSFCVYIDDGTMPASQKVEVYHKSSKKSSTFFLTTRGKIGYTLPRPRYFAGNTLNVNGVAAHFGHFAMRRIALSRPANRLLQALHSTRISEGTSPAGR
jgi:hypothetical protein